MIRTAITKIVHWALSTRREASRGGVGFRAAGSAMDRWTKLVAPSDALALARGSFLNGPVTIAEANLAPLLGDATR